MSLAWHIIPNNRRALTGKVTHDSRLHEHLNPYFHRFTRVRVEKEGALVFMLGLETVLARMNRFVDHNTIATQTDDAFHANILAPWLIFFWRMQS